MAVATQQPIRTPFRRRVLLMRQRFLPVSAWLLAIAVLVVLAGRQYDRMNVVYGVVELNEVSVAPLADGMLDGITVDVFDEVTGDQVVALMDDALVRSELITAQAELAQLRAQLADERRLTAERTAEADAATRRYALDLEEAKLEYLARWAEQESDRVSLRRLATLMARQTAMHEKGVLDELTLEQTQLEHEALRTRLQESEPVLVEARRQIDEAEARQREYLAAAEGVDQNLALGPFTEAIKVQEAVIAGVTERMANLVLRAPIGGKIARIVCRPGEVVPMGAPVLTITDPASRRVLAYVDEKAGIEIAPGDEVHVYAENHPEEIFTAQVIRVGAQVEPFPDQLQTNPLGTLRGRPVLIGLPETHFLPGQTVVVRHTPEAGFFLGGGLL